MSIFRSSIFFWSLFIFFFARATFGSVVCDVLGRLAKSDPSIHAPSTWEELKLVMETRAHLLWRDKNQAIKDDAGNIIGYKPRYKTTDVPNNPFGKGGENLSGDLLTHPFRLQEAIKDGFVVDIASISDPRELPASIQKSNKDSADAAFEAVKKGIMQDANLNQVIKEWESGTVPLSAFLTNNPFVHAGATQIHLKWMENNSYLGSDHSQMKPFDSLSIAEQKKDIDIVIEAAKETITSAISKANPLWERLKLETETRAHLLWRDKNQAIKDDAGNIIGYKPRYKTTDVPNNPFGKGGENLSGDLLTHPFHLQEAIKDGFVVDIASVSHPRELPASIQKSNKDSADAAFEAVKLGAQTHVDFNSVVADWSKVEAGQETLENFLKKYFFVKIGASQIHLKWMENNSYLGSDYPQMKPFDSLSIAEQKKDVDILMNAVQYFLQAN